MTSPRVTDRGPVATEWTDVAEPPDDLRSFVTLSRTHPTDIGERHVFVKLDDTKVRLSYGDSFTAELKPGAHHLRAFPKENAVKDRGCQRKRSEEVRCN